MRIAEPLPADVRVSFEFFPPKTETANANLWQSIQKLAVLRPQFVSVTYGAGGSTRTLTHKTIARLLRETELDPAAHLTCVAASRAQIDAIARQYWQEGVRRIVALRGDPPGGEKRFSPHPRGYGSSVELVAGLKRLADFRIVVAVYPERHPESVSFEADIDHLKRKIDAGADLAISQFFFDPTIFLRFLHKVREKGITIPIIPGLVPLSNFQQTARFAQSCGTSIPDWLRRLFDGLDHDHTTRQLIGASVVAEQCRVLYAHGIRQFHFYTMNKADLCYAICYLMGVRPPSR